VIVILNLWRVDWVFIWMNEWRTGQKLLKWLVPKLEWWNLQIGLVYNKIYWLLVLGTEYFISNTMNDQFFKCVFIVCFFFTIFFAEGMRCDIQVTENASLFTFRRGHFVLNNLIIHLWSNCYWISLDLFSYVYGKSWFPALPVPSFLAFFKAFPIHTAWSKLNYVVLCTSIPVVFKLYFSDVLNTEKDFFLSHALLLVPWINIF